jgi:hypothetical protein
VTSRSCANFLQVCQVPKYLKQKLRTNILDPISAPNLPATYQPTELIQHNVILVHQIQAYGTQLMIPITEGASLMGPGILYWPHESESCKASARCGLGNGNDHRATRYDAREPHLRLAAFVLGSNRCRFPVTPRCPRAHCFILILFETLTPSLLELT